MLENEKVIIVDYGMGNIRSVENAVHYLGYESLVSSEPKVIEQASSLILPGVGSFKKAMQNLCTSGIKDALLEVVTIRKRKILGICLGMQLMASEGEEDGETEGLGLINSKVKRFTSEETAGGKIPHIGFNKVAFANDSILFKELDQSASDFYFVHSYRIANAPNEWKLGITNYGIDFVSAFEKQNVFATQFHPEKSQTNGLRILKNFLEFQC